MKSGIRNEQSAVLIWLRNAAPRRAMRMAFAAVGAVLLGATLSPAPVSANPIEVARRAPVDSRLLEGPVEYLVSKYSVSRQEALRRLELQNALPEITRELKQRFPGEYSGAWIDHAGGGMVRVLATNRATIDRAVGPLRERFTIRTTKAVWSLRELRSTAERTRIALNATDEGASPFIVDIDEVANKVVVWQRETATAAERTMLATALDKATRKDAIEVRTLRMPGRREEASGLGVAADLPPSCREEDAGDGGPGDASWGKLLCYTSSGKHMMGGMRLDIRRDNGSYGGCTNGFNLESTIAPRNGWNYTMTAGHCILGTNHSHQDRSWHGSVAVGLEHDYLVPPAGNLAYNSYPIDYAIMKYYNSQQEYLWMDRHPDYRRARVFIGSNNIEVDISGMIPYETMPVGQVLCATGSGTDVVDYPKTVPTGAGAGYHPGMRCGEIVGKNGGIVTNICSRRGDSGGPLYDSPSRFTFAYGILSDGTAASGPCGASERSWYSPVSKILNRVNSIPGNYGYRLMTYI